MTSNLGTELIQERLNSVPDSNKDLVMERLKDEIFELLKRTLRPEFLNRIDDVIVFKPLTHQEINQIALLQLNKFIEKLKEQGITLILDQSAVNLISTLGFDTQFGARPLKRAIQKYIIDKLSILILEGKFSTGDTIYLSTQNNEFVFSLK